VTTAEWELVRRPDGESVGYLVPDGPLVVPVNLLGRPFGPAQDPAGATALLRARGLAALDRRWWCRLPDLLPPGLLAAERPRPEWGWRAVVLIEVQPAECRLRPEWPAPRELTAQAVLPVPVGDLVRAEPPDRAPG
jgi:hypothetical protein